MEERDHERVKVEPKEGNGEGGKEEEEDGAVEGEAKEGEVARTEGLRAERLDAGGEAGEDRVAGDVGEADGQGAAGKF